MKLGASAMWHSASTGGIIEGLGWTQQQRTQVSKTCARSDGVSKIIFECNQKDFSLSTLCELTTDKPTRCNETPTKGKLAASAWKLAAETNGDWSRTSRAWQSLLVEVGGILHDVAEKNTYLFTRSLRLAYGVDE